jgi:hypothetical protein
VKGRSSWLPLMASASMEAVTAALKLPLRTDGAGALVSWKQGRAGPIGGSRSAAEALLGPGPGRGRAASRLGAVHGAQGRGLAPWALLGVGRRRQRALGRRVPGSSWRRATGLRWRAGNAGARRRLGCAGCRVCVLGERWEKRERETAEWERGERKVAAGRGNQG